MSPPSFKLGIIACGQMGTAILAGILSQEPNAGSTTNAPWNVKRIFVSVQSASSVSRLQNMFAQHLSRITIYQGDNLAVAEHAHVVILGCKPALMEGILGSEGMGDALNDKILISVLAGKTTEMTRKAIGDFEVPTGKATPRVHVVRTMPNMAAREHASMTVVASPEDESDIEAVRMARWLFDHVGKTHEIPESLFDLIGSLVGCSAAMFTVAIEGLLDQSVAGGLNRPDALKLVTQTLFGLAKLLEAGNHPSVLREEISSPGGSTIQGLMELERHGVRSAYASALGVLGERAKALGSKDK
jgi:pyrroline-5-carboxylate reductase